MWYVHRCHSHTDRGLPPGAGYLGLLVLPVLPLGFSSEQLPNGLPLLLALISAQRNREQVGSVLNPVTTFTAFGLVGVKASATAVYPPFPPTPTPLSETVSQGGSEIYDSTVSVSQVLRL